MPRKFAALLATTAALLAVVLGTAAETPAEHSVNVTAAATEEPGWSRAAALLEPGWS
ncbi:hypothetical protein [Streptomyces sp. NPDC012888]|uniref:hypothetical protein n=1 Tax=Streptomyces sp. NPDC012888 TaxID=3364855 RepID=UPI0036A95847